MQHTNDSNIRAKMDTTPPLRHLHLHPRLPLSLPLSPRNSPIPSVPPRIFADVGGLELHRAMHPSDPG